MVASKGDEFFRAEANFRIHFGGRDGLHLGMAVGVIAEIVAIVQYFLCQGRFTFEPSAYGEDRDRSLGIAQDFKNCCGVGRRASAMESQSNFRLGAWPMGDIGRGSCRPASAGVERAQARKER